MSLFFHFSCIAHISSRASARGSAGVNAPNSQGHAPSKTSDLNFQPRVTPRNTSNNNTNTSLTSYQLGGTAAPSTAQRGLQEPFFCFSFLSSPASCLSARRVRRRPASGLPLPAVADTVSNRTFSSPGSLMVLRHARCLLPLVRN